jgi:hypothetical protein
MENNKTSVFVKGDEAWQTSLDFCKPIIHKFYDVKINYDLSDTLEIGSSIELEKDKLSICTFYFTLSTTVVPETAKEKEKEKTEEALIKTKNNHPYFNKYKIYQKPIMETPEKMPETPTPAPTPTPKDWRMKVYDTFIKLPMFIKISSIILLLISLFYFKDDIKEVLYLFLHKKDIKEVQNQRHLKK